MNNTFEKKRGERMKENNGDIFAVTSLFFLSLLSSRVSFFLDGVFEYISTHLSATNQGFREWAIIWILVNLVTLSFVLI